MTEEIATTAPEQTYPEITPAPPASDEPWPLAPDETWVADQRGTIAPEQTYPAIVPAPAFVDHAPVTLSPAAYVDPGTSKFGQALVQSFINAGLMEPPA